MPTYTEEMIKVMQAFQEGKEIETRIRAGRCKGEPQPWFSTSTPAWDWARQEYRVKELARMTYRELAEWLAKGNGQCRANNTTVFIDKCYAEGLDDYEIQSSYAIRHWNSDDWVTPTKDIFQRDCR